MKRLALLALVICTCSACSFAPDYAPPEIEMPREWRVATAEARELSTLPWWESLGDEQLTSLIETALRENKDLRLATVVVEEYYAQYGVSRSELFPQLDASAGAARQYTPSSLKSTSNSFSLGTALSWELDFWGKIRSANEAQRNLLLGQEASRRAVILTLVSSVAEGYIALRELDRELEITRETVAARKKSLELARSQFQAGITSELPARQAEAELAAAEVIVPDIERQIAQEENLLSVLLGHNPGAIARGKSVSTLPTVVNVPAGLPSELLSRRPDIEQAEFSLRAATSQIGVARAAFFPHVSLTGALGLINPELKHLFEGDSKQWQFGAGLAQPVFTAGRLSSELDLAEAQKKEAEVRYLSTVQKAFREVEDALIGLQKASDKRQAQATQVETLQRYLDLAEATYQGGQSSYLDVLDAQRNLLSAKLAQTRTEGAHVLALVELYRSLGGGWVTAAEKHAPAPILPTRLFAPLPER